MMWRGYNERAEPENDKIIKKAIKFAKEAVIDYYQIKGGNHSQEVRVFIDNERANKTKELNYIFEFYNNKENIGKDLDDEDFHFIDDRLLSALKVYRIHLEKDKGNLVSEELEEELRNIDKIIDKNSVEGGNYELYTTLYIELTQIGKVIIDDNSPTHQ